MSLLKVSVSPVWYFRPFALCGASRATVGHLTSEIMPTKTYDDALLVRHKIL